MIPLDVARQLLDFRGAKGSLSEEAAEDQLRGAVALHNMLKRRRVAYLADEVGMGKTYVALGAAALFRHFDPDFRLLVIAPRENIQRKWIKELRNFVRNNVRFPDLRVKAVHGAPARAAVACHSLVELVREAGLNPDRDFFVRLSSFSLPLGQDAEGWRRRRDELLEHVPWLDKDAFPKLHGEENRRAFKDVFGRAMCTALPIFDLVIVDEGHNLKHGFGASVSARNRVLALAFGHPSEKPRGFAGYGPRARRVLFLSATPLENDYVQLWNQLDIFGLGDVAPALCSKDALDDEKRACAQDFLIRRVTSMPVGEERLTKNQYRREWRGGGVNAHDDPLEPPGADRDRQRLIVALVQKKVSEILGHERFNNSFQIGMLASFESFLETAKVAKVIEDDSQGSNFDDPDQTEDADERLGLDVGAVNGLARSYLSRFGREMPHPKMDALVERLARGLPRGEKALVFVRRVASVKELRVKLEERYDDWLIRRLRSDLPEHADRLGQAFDAYLEERKARRARRAALVPSPTPSLDPDEDGPTSLVGAAPEEPDTGGIESFFAYFFRGEGPPGILSGATLARRFIQASSAYSTFFDDNYVAWLLDVRPDGSGSVLEALSRHLGRDSAEVKRGLLEAVPSLLPRRKDRSVGRQHLFFALQMATLDALSRSDGALRDRARVVRQLLDNPQAPSSQRGGTAPSGSERWLEEPTFFTELRARPELRGELWPAPAHADFREAFREQELRRLLLGSMARLGHAFIDFYVLAVGRIGSLKAGARETEDLVGLMRDFLDLLDRQRLAVEPSEFRAYSELVSAARHFDLILDVNAPDLRTLPLVDVPRAMGGFLRRQQPIGGMFGQIDQTLVRQFRMPGYPFVLITTDLLQEGEDLHTFCSSVHHYGISWMPSSMEQRVGRIDRVNSATERRLTRLNGALAGDHKLQVYYPHLRDTVEVLQVRRVLSRLNRFLRLMHRDLGMPDQGERQIDIAHEIHRLHEDVTPITDALHSAFPVRDETLNGTRQRLAVEPAQTERLLERFRRFKELKFRRLRIDWEAQAPDDALLGTVRLARRQQPFTLLLRSFGGRLMVRCVSPIGRLDVYDREDVGRETWPLPVQVAAIYDPKFETYNLAVEREVLLSGPAHDLDRVEALIEAVVDAADDLEARLLQTDQAIGVFREDLNRESDRV